MPGMWARLRADLNLKLRRGAWYRITRLDPLQAVLEVGGRLLGILLTTGYGYAAQIAVSSLGAGRQPATEPATVVPATNSLDGVWYGGVLDPVTVESRSGGARASASQGKVLSRPTVRCSEAHPTRFRAVS